MKKLNSVITGVMYEVKRQYPMIGKLSRGMKTVQRELNGDGEKSKKMKRYH